MNSRQSERHGGRIASTRDERAYLFAKRTLDITVCLLALPIVAPIIAICVLAIRLESPGNAFFRQRRTGLGGRRFTMLKLRSMVSDAESRRADLAHLNRFSFPDFKPLADPRVTRVGAFLRRTSLDELPQLINVLRGDMSLVGPRPTSFPAKDYRLWHTARLSVRPGITGLWQINGRGVAGFDERLRLDIEYVRRRSMALDLIILMRTLPAVWTQRGAD